MNILFSLHTTGFESLQENENKEAETVGEEILHAIKYIENSDKASFSDLKKRVEADYVLNKAEYPRAVTTVHSPMLNYKPNYNSNRTFQPSGVSNQLMFAQRRKTGYNRYKRKEKKQIPSRNLDHITCNDCG